MTTRNKRQILSYDQTWQNLIVVLVVMMMVYVSVNTRMIKSCKVQIKSRTDGIESGNGTQCFISIVFCRNAEYKISSVVVELVVWGMDALAGPAFAVPILLVVPPFEEGAEASGCDMLNKFLR